MTRVVTLGVSLLCALAWPTGCVSSDPHPDPVSDPQLWVAPDLDLARYGRVIIDPVDVRLSPGAAAKRLDPRHLARLTLTLHTALERAVRDAYPVVQQPAPDVLRLRATITDVTPTRIEAEIQDSRSGRRLLAVVDPPAGERGMLPDGETGWGQVEKALQEWASGFRTLLDERRAAKPGALAAERASG